MIKKVSYCLYVHKSNLAELLNSLSESEVCRLSAIIDFADEDLDFIYDIVKYDKKTNNISLIACPTWDILNEPIVEDSICFRNNGLYRVIKGGTKVYHHKWQFVSDNYNGFNINESKHRSEEWESIPEIKHNKSRIGNKDYWYALLKKYNLNI